MKLYTEELARLLTENLLENDKIISDNLSSKIEELSSKQSEITDIEVNDDNTITLTLFDGRKVTSKNSIIVKDDQLLSELKTDFYNYFSNMQILLTQLVYTTTNNIGKTMIENIKTILSKLNNDEKQDIVLEKISVVYTGGDVYIGALLTDLSGITVTAIYSDGSTKNITDYILSGEILEGNNVITVSYNGKTETFTVVGLPIEENVSTDNDPPFNALIWNDGTRITGAGKEYVGHDNYSTTDYINITNIIEKSITITRNDEVSGNVGYFYEFYDNEKLFISGNKGYINANNASDYQPSVTFKVPENATYCRICGTKLSGITFSEIVKITVL